MNMLHGCSAESAVAREPFTVNLSIRCLFEGEPLFGRGV